MNLFYSLFPHVSLDLLYQNPTYRRIIFREVLIPSLKCWRWKGIMSKHINVMLGEKCFRRTVILNTFLSNFPNRFKLKDILWKNALQNELDYLSILLIASAHLQMSKQQADWSVCWWSLPSIISIRSLCWNEAEGTLSVSVCLFYCLFWRYLFSSQLDQSWMKSSSGEQFCCSYLCITRQFIMHPSALKFSLTLVWI